jgi:hypothetical protein
MHAPSGRFASTCLYLQLLTTKRSQPRSFLPPEERVQDTRACTQGKKKSTRISRKKNNTKDETFPSFLPSCLKRSVTAAAIQFQSNIQNYTHFIL